MAKQHQEIVSVPRAVPARRRQQALGRLGILSDSALKTGLHLAGSSGSGKSRYLGRVIAWQALGRGLPVVVLDPTGGVIQNIVDKIARLPRDLRKQVWKKIIYVDAGATDSVVPTPLYDRISEHETLFQIANRFPAVLKRQDPQLQSAPILGWNSLHECAIHAGRIAAALDRQLDFVADLVSRPRLYKAELRQALALYPELEDAVAYFRELMDPNAGSLRDRRTGSFRNKLLPFLSDPTLLAAFAAPRPGVDWEEVAATGKLVLIDFQHEHEPERRQFKLIYWARSFIDYAKRRGMGGRGNEIFFLIDEVTQLLGNRTLDGNAILAEDLEELVAVLGRNFGINTVIAHQNLSQVDERIRNILMQMGTQVIGNMTNPEDRFLLARQFFHYDPYWVKKREPVWMNTEQFSQYGYSLQYSAPEIIDYRTEEFSADEQLHLLMSKFSLPRFNFVVRPATAEGTISERLYRISIENLDRDQYPDTAQVDQVLGFLRQKCGVPLEELLAEIHSQRKGEDGRTGQERQRTAKKQVKGTDPPAILEDDDTPDANPPRPRPDVPHRGDGLRAPAPAQGEEGEPSGDIFWR